MRFNSKFDTINGFKSLSTILLIVEWGQTMKGTLYVYFPLSFFWFSLKIHLPIYITPKVYFTISSWRKNKEVGKTCPNALHFPSCEDAICLTLSSSILKQFLRYLLYLLGF